MTTTQRDWCLAGVIAVSLLSCDLSVAQCPDAAPTNEASAWIVFGSFRGGDFSSSVHRIRPDGSGECQVSLHPNGRPGSLDPIVAPDGSRITFTRGHGGSHRVSVWEMNRDGAAERALTGGIMTRFNNGRASPRYAPDGQRIVLVAEEEGKRILRVIDASGAGLAELGPGEFPAWSPDGSRLAFTEEGAEGSQVWVMQSDGSERRQVTSGLENAYPNWSPDGTRLVVSRRYGDTYDLYTITLDGSTIHRLTNTPEVSETQASWSPDGALIAFSAVPPDAPDGWQKSIYVVPAQGGTPRQVTSSQFHDSSPSWMGSGGEAR